MSSCKDAPRCSGNTSTTKHCAKNNVQEAGKRAKFDGVLYKNSERTWASPTLLVCVRTADKKLHKMLEGTEIFPHSPIGLRIINCQPVKLANPSTPSKCRIAVKLPPTSEKRTTTKQSVVSEPRKALLTVPVLRVTHKDPNNQHSVSFP